MAESREPTAAPEAPPAASDGGKAVVEPHPQVRRIRRASVLLALLGAIVAMAVLTFRLAPQAPPRIAEAPAHVIVQPLPTSQLERAAATRLPRPEKELGGESRGGGEEAQARERASAYERAVLEASVRRRRSVRRSLRPVRLEVRRPSGAGGAERRAAGAGPSPFSLPGSSLPPTDGVDAAVAKTLAGLAAASPPAPRASTPASAPDPRVLRRKGPHAVRVSLEAPLTPYTLAEGSYLPATLAQALASDLAGTVRAVISRDVFDSISGSHLLVPRGTLALGRVSRQPLAGEARLVVLWDRLVFPDSRSLALADLPAAGGDGALGLPGRVDRHWGSRVGTALLLSLAGAGVQLSQPQRSAASGLAPGPGQLAAGELGLELGRLSEETLRRALALPPTIELTPGARVYLLTTQDLAFDAPYRGR